MPARELSQSHCYRSRNNYLILGKHVRISKCKKKRESKCIHKKKKIIFTVSLCFKIHSIFLLACFGNHSSAFAFFYFILFFCFWMLARVLTEVLGKVYWSIDFRVGGVVKCSHAQSIKGGVSSDLATQTEQNSQQERNYIAFTSASSEK